MAGQDYCTERGEAKEDKSENGIDEVEEVRTDAVGDATKDDGAPLTGHQAGGDHQDSQTEAP